MPHLRSRHIMAQVLAKLKFARVVTIQGARQTGKSVLAREILPKLIKGSSYISLDSKREKTFAENNPESFLQKYKGAGPLIIDEAQKAPELFDAVKLHVDQDTRPGQFILLGSTEFSREVQVRESLTGRISRVKIHPFTISEANQLSLNPSKSPALINSTPRVRRKELLLHLEHGGLPGISFVRNQAEKESLMEEWLRVTCERDILQFKNSQPDPELAENILRALPSLDTPETSYLNKKVNASAYKVNRHVELLRQLFVLNELHPHPLGTGKIRYFLSDVGLAHFLEADFHRQLLTWLIIEQLSQRISRGELSTKFFYYRGAKGGVIDLVVEHRKGGLSAYKILSQESFDLRDLEILKAFHLKCVSEGIKVNLYAFAPAKNHDLIENIAIVPWESIV